MGKEDNRSRIRANTDGGATALTRCRKQEATCFSCSWRQVRSARITERNSSALRCCSRGRRARIRAERAPPVCELVVSAVDDSAPGVRPEHETVATPSLCLPVHVLTGIEETAPVFDNTSLLPIPPVCRSRSKIPPREGSAGRIKQSSSPESWSRPGERDAVGVTSIEFCGETLGPEADTDGVRTTGEGNPSTGPGETDRVGVRGISYGCRRVQSASSVSSFWLTTGNA